MRSRKQNETLRRPRIFRGCQVTDAGKVKRELWESKIISMTIHGTAGRGVSALMEGSARRSLLNSFTVRF